MKPSEIILGMLRIPIDFLMGIAAFVLAYQIRSITDLIPGTELPLDLGVFPPLNEYIIFSAIAVIALQILFATGRLYALKTDLRFSSEVGRIVVFTSVWLLLIITYYFLIREYPFSRLALIYSFVLTIILISFGRLIIRIIESILFSYGIGRTNLLFIGNNSITAALAKSFEKNKKFKIKGLIDEQLRGCENISALGKIDELKKIIRKYKIEEIIQTDTKIKETDQAFIRDFCRQHQIDYSFVPDLLTVQKTNIEIATLAGIPIIKMKPTPLDGWGRVIKRAFDTCGALFGLIILSPFLLVIAILIKADSKGTVFFKYLDDGSRVKRVGQRGRLFNFYKFRTMHPKTHNLRYTELSQNNTRKNTPLVKIQNDPRVTRLGKFLRRTSIDELPQLINVLKGEMSLVGPRPHMPEEVAKYKDHQKFVLTIKPGITGLAQISGRSDLDFNEEVRLDSYYIENWSPWLDIKIILRSLLIPFKSHKE